MDTHTADTLIFEGPDALKSLEVKDGTARVGAYGIRFSDANSKDLTGEYFTAATDYGPRNGDGVSTLFNHGFLSADGLSEEAQKTLDSITARTFAPVKAIKDDVGIFIETTLNLFDEYEKAIFELAQAGKLKWSSGTAAHLMRKSAGGEITRWHPIEFSYTPTPAEPRLPAIAPLKSVALDKAQATELAKAFAPPVDSAKSADSRITISQTPTMTPEQEAAQKAETDFQATLDKRASDVEEMLAIGTAHGCVDAAKSFIKDKKPLSDFQTHVLTNVLKARPVQPDEGKIGMDAKEQKRYSLVKAMLEMATKGRLSGLELEAHDAAVKAVGRSVDTKGFIIPEDVVRGFGRMSVKTANQVATGTAGGFLVDTDMGPMIELLRNKPQVVAAGATTMSGLVGDVLLPVQTGTTTAYWVAETAALTDSNSTFSQKRLSPKRLGVTIPYTTQLLAQASLDVESFIRGDAVRVLSIEKDRAALSGTGATGEPVGVANTTGINATVTYSGAAEWADLVEHETGIAVDNADIGSMAFIIDATTRGKWKSALKVATYGGTGYLMDDNNRANGYPVFTTNQTFATAHQSFFGVWSQLILASWAGMEVIVDPYALKKSGQVEITFNELCDILVRQPLAFNVSTDSAGA